MAENASFRLTRMYKRTAKSGSTYFSGRLAFGKITLVKSRETTEDGSEIWSLLIEESQNSMEQRSIEKASGGTAPRETRKPYADKQLDDEIPF